MLTYAGLKMCAKKDCTSTFKNDRWGAIRAQSEGWFIQRDGTAWCPSDIPTWVPQWRLARITEPVSNNNKPDPNENQPLPKGPTGMWETRGGDPNPTPSEQKAAPKKQDKKPVVKEKPAKKKSSGKKKKK